MYNKSIKFAHKQRGLDAAPKTRIATYFRRYILKTREIHV